MWNFVVCVICALPVLPFVLAPFFLTYLFDYYYQLQLNTNFFVMFLMVLINFVLHVLLVYSNMCNSCSVCSCYNMFYFTIKY